MHIPAILTHPEIMGPPLERGVRYAHHFVVELISDGRRLWAVASEEGKNVIHQIEHGIDPSAEIPQRKGPTIEEWMDAGYKAVNYPPSGYEAVSTHAEIAAAVAKEQEAEAVTDQSGTGGEAEQNQTGVAEHPILPPPAEPPESKTQGGDLPPGNKAGEPPVTTVTSATSFDS
ncbi:hypothetical protein ABIB86_000456 [Bradyrhizobium sp. JR1.7]|uniref:hypothetical protein n=1 Tax=unclassified Bradyrhizobium TaxID=2631580 RepID=UPI0033936F97